MHPVIAKTFGGLSSQYYFRQLFFGFAFLVLLLSSMFHSQSRHPMPINFFMFQVVLAVISTLLYPYSRYVYESVINFFMGNNVFFVNAFIMLFMKILTMLFCFSFAIFIAPIGLAYLYYHHSKNNG